MGQNMCHIVSGIAASYDERSHVGFGVSAPTSVPLRHRLLAAKHAAGSGFIHIVRRGKMA